MARILLIDDDETFLDVLTHYLSGRGHAVSRCSNPAQARSLAERVGPDLVITDFHMPGMNGSEMVALLRRAEKLRDVPALFLSGLDALHYATAMPPDRKSRFLGKPVDFEELEGAIKALLDPEGWSKNDSAA